MKLHAVLFIAPALLGTPGFAQDEPSLEARIDTAIDAGISWLVRHQAPDGSWSGEALTKTCRGDSKCNGGGDEERDVYGEGLTALAVLVLLREGITPLSEQTLVDPLDGRTRVAGDVSTRGLAWLRDAHMEDGSFGRYYSPFLYNHCLATIAFAETARIAKIDGCGQVAQHALAFLEGAQKPNPDGEGLWGWRYAARQIIEGEKAEVSAVEFAERMRDADTSVTGWAALALRAGRDAGLVVHQENVDGAVRFINATKRLSGKVGYLDREGAGEKVLGTRDEYDYHAAVMSALAIHVLLAADEEPKHSFLQRAANALLHDLPQVSESRKSIDYYYWFHGTLALSDLQRSPKGEFLTAEACRAWYTTTAEALLALSSTDEDSCARGGWLVHDRWCHTGGPTYATTFALLTLQLCRAAL